MVDWEKASALEHLVLLAEIVNGDLQHLDHLLTDVTDCRWRLAAAGSFLRAVSEGPESAPGAKFHAESVGTIAFLQICRIACSFCVVQFLVLSVCAMSVRAWWVASARPS